MESYSTVYHVRKLDLVNFGHHAEAGREDEQSLTIGTVSVSWLRLILDDLKDVFLGASDVDKTFVFIDF